MNGTPVTREELIAVVGKGQSDHVRQVLRSGWGGVLKPAWKALLEDLPDRFVIGTDVDPATLKTYAEEIGYWRGILGQLSPATAAKLAHENAERLLKALARARSEDLPAETVDDLRQEFDLGEA